MLRRGEGRVRYLRAPVEWLCGLGRALPGVYRLQEGVRAEASRQGFSNDPVQRGQGPHLHWPALHPGKRQSADGGGEAEGRAGTPEAGGGGLGTARISPKRGRGGGKKLP